MENSSAINQSEQQSIPVTDLNNSSKETGSCATMQTIPPEAILAVVLGTMGILINLLSLLAICHVTVKITTHFRLIVSLACSDILIGITIMLSLLHHTINPIYGPGCGAPDARFRSACMYVIIKAVNSTGLTVCLLNLIGMAIDHYIAILKPFEYNRILGKMYGTIMIIVIWVTGTILGFSGFIFLFTDELNKQPNLNFCEKIKLAKYAEEYCVFVITFIAGVIIVYTYLKIYRRVKTLQFRETNTFVHSSALIRSSISKVSCFTRSKKALFTTLFIIGTFVLCWLPICLYNIILLVYVKVNPMALIPHIMTLHKVDRYIYNLVLVNVLIDPIIYAVRIGDIRHGYYRFFLRFQNCDKSEDLPKGYVNESTPREKTSLTGSLEKA